LLRERYEPKDLFGMIEKVINLEGGILSVDDKEDSRHYILYLPEPSKLKETSRSEFIKMLIFAAIIQVSISLAAIVYAINKIPKH